MKKLLFVLCLMAPLLSSYAQELVFEHPISLKQGLKDRRDAVQVFDKNKENLSLFIINPNLIYGLLLDSNFKMQSSMQVALQDSKFKNAIGGYFSNNIYSLLLSDDAYGTFIRLDFDYQ